MSRNPPSQPDLEQSILTALRQVFGVVGWQPQQILRATRLLVRQYRAARRRRRHAVQGLQVPPFAIFSVTSQCNLNCFGCYANELRQHSEREEMDRDEISNLLSEAHKLGVSVVLLAGGEPLLKPQLLQITQAEPGILFLLFTNATLLDSAAIRALKGQPHVIPVLSIEGSSSTT
ncbi:MAG TPA: radical SAM protein, partial [Candidatus Acetothermia bacterium]|nr:radical SAM protein [Candidatus Acetothermia bacterium]